jgi:hypothetical protein
MHPEAARIAGAAAFGDYHTNEGVIMAGLGVCFGGPLGKLLSGAVFDFQHQPLPVHANPGDIPAVFDATLHPAVDAIIFQGCCEVVSDSALGAGAGGAG